MMKTKARKTFFGEISANHSDELYGFSAVASLEIKIFSLKQLPYDYSAYIERWI